MLAVAPTWTAVSSINRRRTTPIMPIAMSQQTLTLHRPLPKEPVNAPRQQTTRRNLHSVRRSNSSDLPRFPPLEVCGRRPPNAWRRHHEPASENLHTTGPRSAANLNAQQQRRGRSKNSGWWQIAPRSHGSNCFQYQLAQYALASPL
jgi:hypothetical protein